MDIEFLRSLGSTAQVAQYLKVNGYDQGSIDKVLQKLVDIPPTINDESTELFPETPIIE
jgi:hypothetical protein